MAIREQKELEFGAKIEKFFRQHELRPYEKLEHRGFTVYLAEGGPYHVKNPSFPRGWYESAYALLYRDPTTQKQICFVCPLMFEIDHDLDLGSDDSRRKARVTSAKRAAFFQITQFYQVWNGSIIRAH